MPFSFDYPPVPDSALSYWGVPDATINWCEDDYLFTPYIAEMFNSVSNIPFCLVALQHLYSAVKNKHGWDYVLTSIGFMGVGIGSFFFHCSLLYKYQLCDELPMVYVTAIPFSVLMGYDKTPRARRLWLFATFISLFAFTYIYIFVYRNAVFHQVFYALLNFGMIYKSFVGVQTAITDPKVRAFEHRLLGLAVGLFAFGFLVWNIDNICCGPIGAFRRNVLRLPLGILTEGHAWWHVFTCMGIYYFILYNEVLSTWIRGVQDSYQLVWHGPFGELRLITPHAKAE